MRLFSVEVEVGSETRKMVQAGTRLRVEVELGPETRAVIERVAKETRDALERVVPQIVERKSRGTVREAVEGLTGRE